MSLARKVRSEARGEPQLVSQVVLPSRAVVGVVKVRRRRERSRMGMNLSILADWLVVVVGIEVVMALLAL